MTLFAPRLPLRGRRPAGLLTLLAIVCAVLAITHRAAADGTAWPGDMAGRVAAGGWHAETPYFVDFRSRPGYLFGHTFIVYGRLDASGQVVEAHYAGIYPRDDELGLVLGSLIPVPASVRGVKGDFEEPATALYRRKLTEAEYARLTAAVRHASETKNHWNLLTYNCNDFAVEVARALNMRTPPSLLLPANFIAGLRLLNGD